MGGVSAVSVMGFRIGIIASRASIGVTACTIGGIDVIIVPQIVTRAFIATHLAKIGVVAVSVMWFDRFFVAAVITL